MRVLLVQPSLAPPGGGNGVAAWILEALKGRCELAALVLEPVDLDRVNRFFGTSLAPSDVRVEVLRPALQRLLRRVPLPLGLLKQQLLAAAARRRLRRGEHDVAITANNETDLGGRGVQYVHFPRFYRPRPEVDLRWFHGGPLLGAYERLCALATRTSLERQERNATLVNSDWTGRKVRERYPRAEPRTVDPPVAGAFAMDRPWEERDPGFVAIGRIAPEKRIELLIDVVAAVRARGHEDVHLHVDGTPGEAPYHERIARLARANAAFVFLHEDLARKELLELVAAHRSGIHGMAEEPFGMAVAEMVRAGLVVFVPRGGGQVEIVGEDDRLLFETRDEAVLKILRALEDPALGASLREGLAARRPLFSAERVVREVREVVDAL